MILKHRDREVLRFDWGRYGDVRNVEINPKAERYLPIVLREKAGKGDVRQFEYALDDWLGSRTAPLNRRNVRDMLQSMGFKPRDPLYRKALIEFCRGLSLNDVHWVVKDDSSERWADANLYRNEFSTAIATMAFSGAYRENRRNAMTSPEYTTDGTLAKCWRRIDGEILLFKAGSGSTGLPDSNAHGFEPHSEYFAAQVAAAMGLDHVDYDLSRFKGRLCSTCKLFTSERFGYLPVRGLLNAEQAASDIRFADIFFFDAVIFNTDRHLGNFGFLVDNETNEIAGLAPIFDNGYGLFSQAICNPGRRNDEFHDLRRFVNRKSPALLKSWLDIPGGVTDSMVDRLAGLRDFNFKPHPTFRLPSDRKEMTLYFLRNRIEQIRQFRAKADTKIAIGGLDDTLRRKTATRRDDRSLDAEIKDTLRSFPKAKRENLAKLFKVSLATITRHLRALQLAGEISRVGSRKTGHWEVFV